MEGIETEGAAECCGVTIEKTGALELLGMDRSASLNGESGREFK
jgi:hypothetical protein